jgi:hypothetical protein
MVLAARFLLAALLVAGCSANPERTESSAQALPADDADDDPIPRPPPDDHVGATCPAKYPTCSTSKTPTPSLLHNTFRGIGCTAPIGYTHLANNIAFSSVTVCPKGTALNNVLASPQAVAAKAHAASSVCDACLAAADPGYVYVFYATFSYWPHCTGGCINEPPPY